MFIKDVKGISKYELNWNYFRIIPWFPFYLMLKTFVLIIAVKSGSCTDLYIRFKDNMSSSFIYYLLKLLTYDL